MRVACVDLPAMPLQLVWRHRPDWRQHPVVVVQEDRPQGVVLWACERARALRVLPGQRYAHALGLCRGLRAQVVAPEVIAAAEQELMGALARLSPRVEGETKGTFWLDGEGLGTLYPSGTRWGAEILEVVRGCGYAAVAVVGFSRFATYAIARATTPARTAGRPLVLRTAEAERAATAAVPLARLEIAPKLRDTLARLGVTTLGQLIALPGPGILERFGAAAHQLHQLAAQTRWDPVVPQAPPQARDERVLLDDEERDVEGLLFVIKGALDRLLARLAADKRALTALHLELKLRHAVNEVSLREACLKPAEATLDGRALLRLVHLRLEHQPPEVGVVEVRLWADEALATREQLALFAEKPRRELRAADEVLARLRAELGEDAVVTARLREGHLPEAHYGWERLSKLPKAAPRSKEAVEAEAAALGEPVVKLVRRVLARPRPIGWLGLPPPAAEGEGEGEADGNGDGESERERDRDRDRWRERAEHDAPRGAAELACGRVVRLHGPYVISGGWWASAEGHEVHRAYHYAETERGHCLWIYYDRARRRWCWQGSVE